MQKYLEYTGSTLDTLKEQYREPSEKKVKTQLVLDAIKQDLNLELTDEDVDQEIERMAKAQKKEFDEVKSGMKEQQLEYIKDRAIFEKVLKTLVDGEKIKIAKA